MLCPICEEEIVFGYIIKVEENGVLYDMVGCGDCAKAEPEETGEWT